MSHKDDDNERAHGSGRPDGAHEPVAPQTEYQDEVSELEQRSATAARLFDIRGIIGGLFVIYGIIVTIAGFTASDADIKKAQDININLWTGLGMLILGLLFLLWLKLRPVTPSPATDGPSR